MLLSRALRASSEEFELVVEVFITCGELDFFFQFMHRAGGVDGLDGAAIGADEVVAVLAGDDEGEVSGALVESEAAHDALVGEPVEEAVEGGLVAKGGEAGGFGELREIHGAARIEEGAEEFLEGLGPAQSGLAAAVQGIDRGD